MMIICQLIMNKSLINFKKKMVSYFLYLWAIFIFSHFYHLIFSHYDLIKKFKTLINYLISSWK